MGERKAKEFRVRIPESRCLDCGHVLTGAARAPGQPVTKPRPGDVTICLECGHIQAFADDLTMRALSEEEMTEIAGDPEIVAMVNAIVAAKEAGAHARKSLLEMAEVIARRQLILRPAGAMLERICIMEFEGGDHAVVECPWSSQRERRATLYALRKTMHEMKARAYCVVSEAWVATYPAGDAIKVMPRDRPDRQEVVTACAVNGMGHEFKAWDIVRDDLGRVIHLPPQKIPYGDTTGDLTELLKWPKLAMH